MIQTYVQFTAGRGPVECAAACEQIIRKFVKELNSLDVKFDFVDYEEDDEYGYRSAIIKFNNTPIDIILNLKSKWEGTIKFIATKNNFRPNHKRKNWFVGCNFFDVDDSKITLDMKDVKIDLLRASGPGGQNVNKVETGVRLTHIPTGIIVKCIASRDQRQNFKLAKEILQAKINVINEEKNSNIKNLFWLSHDSLERGGEIMTIKGEI